MGKIPIRNIKGTRSKPDFSNNFTIRAVESLLAGVDMVQELHRHDFYYLLVVKQGKGNHDIDFVHYEINDHTVFFIRPAQVHKLHLKAGSTGYLVQFRSEFYFHGGKSSNLLLRKVSATNHYLIDGVRFQKLIGVLTYIFEEYTDKLERYEEVIRENMNILFIELSRHINAQFSGNIKLHMQERLEKFLTLLETNIFTHKQVADYAAMLNLTAFQLNTITKAALGKTSSELINDQIILEAKRCLLGTSSQVNETAYRLGYEDVSYFIRFFKKHTGYSPETFRHNFR